MKMYHSGLVPVKEIDCWKKEESKCNAKLNFSPPSTTPVRARRKSITPSLAYQDATNNVLSMLSTCGSKPVFLSLVEPYASRAVVIS